MKNFRFGKILFFSALILILLGVFVSCGEKDFDPAQTLDNFNVPALDQINSVEISFNCGRHTVSIEDREQIEEIYEYMQGIEAYPCGTMKGIYGGSYCIKLYTESSEFSLAMVGDDTFRVTGAKDVDGYSQMFMTCDIKPLISYLDILASDHQIEQIENGKTVNDIYELLGMGQKDADGAYVYNLMDGRKVRITYDSEIIDYINDDAKVSAVEVLGESAEFIEEPEPDVPRLVSIDGVVYSLNDDEKSYAVKGIDLINAKSKLKIEDYICGLPVTCIGDSAFSFANILTKVIIPDTVTEIRGGVFYYCENLKSVTIPSSVEIMGQRVFDECPNVKVRCEADERPDGWHEHWNTDYYGKHPCDVVWGR